MPKMVSRVTELCGAALVVVFGLAVPAAAYASVRAAVSAYAMTPERTPALVAVLIEVTRKRPGAWWRDDFTPRFAVINGLPGVIVDSPKGPVQTAAFEIEGGLIWALYVVRNVDKLRHLAAAPAPHKRGGG
jgi:hypothetical protein